jgi:carboxyl-terminal processing protease
MGRWLAGAGLIIGVVMAATMPPIDRGASNESAGRAAQAEPAPPLGQEQARNYALYLDEVAKELASKFVRPVASEKLAAAAAKGLYEAAGQPVPEELHDPDKAFAGKDVVEELTRVRQALGDIAELRGDAGIRAGIEAMTAVLDPHSSYLTQDEHSRLRRGDAIQVGTGLTLEERRPPGPLVVKFVTLGQGTPTAAQQAGIRPGDHLLEIDGQPTRRLTFSQAMERLGGLPETETVVTVQTPGSEPRKVKLARRSFQEEAVVGFRRLADGWEHLLDRKDQIGLIRLASLGKGSSTEVYYTLAELKESGMRGLVLDLRDCPGGFLNEAVAVADLFWGQDLMANVQYRTTREPAKHAVNRTDRFRDFPMVVLVGPDTSGGGELIAAALQDFKRATVAGQRSRGKGSVQELTELGGTHAVRLTTGLIIRPSGRNLHRFPDSKRSDDWGIQPADDLQVPLSPDLRRQIRLWWHLQSVRPPHSREALPLDRPESDPALSAAVEFLRTQIR